MSNNNDLSQPVEDLREAVSKFLIPVQTTRAVDVDAFQILYERAIGAVRMCKGRPDVPKALLVELLGTYSVLRAEAPYLGAKRQVLEGMADKVESCFRMILADEVPEERQAGVPRIV
ncbi:MAG: hypothetical protein ABJE95_22580 [Byssovorax sp.]